MLSDSMRVLVAGSVAVDMRAPEARDDMKVTANYSAGSHRGVQWTWTGTMICDWALAARAGRKTSSRSSVAVRGSNSKSYGSPRDTVCRAVRSVACETGKSAPSFAIARHVTGDEPASRDTVRRGS